MEGFFDCTKISQAGYPFVVAPMGRYFSAQQERLLVAHSDQVLLMFEAAMPGRRIFGGLAAGSGYGL